MEAESKKERKEREQREKKERKEKEKEEKRLLKEKKKKEKEEKKRLKKAERLEKKELKKIEKARSKASKRRQTLDAGEGKSPKNPNHEKNGDDNDAEGGKSQVGKARSATVATSKPHEHGKDQKKNEHDDGDNNDGGDVKNSAKAHSGEQSVSRAVGKQIESADNHRDDGDTVDKEEGERIEEEKKKRRVHDLEEESKQKRAQQEAEAEAREREQIAKEEEEERRRQEQAEVEEKARQLAEEEERRRQKQAEAEEKARQLAEEEEKRRLAEQQEREEEKRLLAEQQERAEAERLKREADEKKEAEQLAEEEERKRAEEETKREKAERLKREAEEREGQRKEEKRQLAEKEERKKVERLKQQTEENVNTKDKNKGVIFEAPPPHRDRRNTVSAARSATTPILSIPILASVTAIDNTRVRKPQHESSDCLEPRKRAHSSVTPRSGGVAARWQQAMDANLSAKSQNLTDQADDRVDKGLKWMEDQLKALIAAIKKHGVVKDGKPTVTFGVLFAATIDTMPALSATIATAKKRGIVSYEGDMLLQSVHDDAGIVLINETVQSPAAVERRQIVPPANSQSEPALSHNEKCVVCNKTAYPLERAVASGKVFHKACFKCSVCKCVLKVIDYAHLDGTFYCQTHFQQLFLMKGDYKAGFSMAAEGAISPRP